MDDDRVCLTMSEGSLLALQLRAAVASEDPGAPAGGQALLNAIAECEPTAQQSRGQKLWRIRCTEQVLGFMRMETPDIARRWPAVFGQVEMPRSLTLALLGEHAVGRSIAGLEVDRDGVAKLVLEGGGAIVLKPDGAIDYAEAV